MTDLTTAQPIAAHKFEREANEHYVEPHWCSERLFAEEKFEGSIWDPCCGFGRIPEAAKAAGHAIVATDISDRGYKGFDGPLNFLHADDCVAHNIVCNPPFNIAQHFAQHALSLSNWQKIAMVFPTARLNAARWLEETPLARVWLMTPRPSMPPGYTIARGEKPQGGKMDFCWLVWSRGRIGPADVRWLRRDA
jgi:hypothetical protein